MDIQTPSNNQCSRTYWTPAMERFFIDLMVEHMQKGNRYGHTFNKHAWADMLAVFNTRFGSTYDKDSLKGRYTNLWKQFNDIKILLNNNRFSWDETRQMVVSDDYTWDSYIKDHPEARTYKTKVVLNFDDLCFIYGYTVADGRYSLSSHDMDVEEDAGLADGTGTTAPSGSKRSKIEWTTNMDNHFLELLQIQYEKGNKLESTFSKQDWTDVLLLFNAKFGPQHHKRVLKQRYKKLGKCYRDLNILIQQNGFSWDEKENMVIASDDVWDAYIKAHPHARLFRGKIFPNYLIMSLLFRNEENKGSQIVSIEDKDREGQVTVKKTGSERSRTHWTQPMDEYFIELMLDHVRRGNRIGQAFINQSWIEMVTSFNVRFDSNHDKEVLKNRYKHFRRLYNEVKAILENGEFSWDQERERVNAEDHVWEAYIKAHPHARPFSVKTVPFYKKLCVIYGSDNCDEIYSTFAWNSDLDPFNIRMIDLCEDLLMPVPITETSDQYKKRRTTSSLDMENIVKFQKVDQIVTHGSGGLQLARNDSGMNYSALENAIEALQAVPDIDDDFLLDACDLLEDETEAKTFLALDATLRKKWLLRKIRQQ